MAIPKKKELANEQKLKKAATIFYDALMRKERKSPGLRDVIVFHAQKASFGELVQDSPTDHAYWKEKGWLSPQAKYYVDVPVNPIYNAIGWTAEKLLRRKIRKDMAEAQK